MDNAFARIASNTFVQAVGVYAAVIVVGLFFREGCEMVYAVGLTAFTICAPLMITAKPHFWRNLGIFVLCWFALMLLMEPTCEALLGHTVGEEAMIFLVPFMLFPVLLLAAVPVHFFRRSVKPSSASDGKPGRR